jgi:carboxylesterase type B
VLSTFLWGTQFRTTAGNRSPVHTYWGTHVPPESDTTNPITPAQDASSADAYHGSGLYYPFGSLAGSDRPWTASDYAVADTMSSYVANFAAAGDPQRAKPHRLAVPADDQGSDDGDRQRLRVPARGRQQRQVRLPQAVSGGTDHGLLTPRSGAVSPLSRHRLLT